MYVIAIALGFQTFPTISIDYFFKDNLELTPTQLALFNSISSSVWLLKPLFGFISDSFEICGTKRKFYLCFFSLLQVIAWIVLSQFVNGFWGAVFVQSVVNMGTGFINVIGEAIMVELSAQEPENNNTARNISNYLTLTAISMLISSYLGGFLLNFYSVRYVFLITALFPMTTFAAGLFAKEKQN